MHYQFPRITHIEDVLPHIDEACFRQITKEGLTFITYRHDGLDVFPIVEGTPREKLRAAVRRECRGIAFHAEQGYIVSRPWHKFFNIGQRPDTQPHMLDVGLPHIALEKLDGSMIRPLPIDGTNMRWGTKMGVTDVAMLAEVIVAGDARYIDLAWDCANDGYTPLFELCSRDNRIVLDYAEPQLILTGIRHNVDGHYITHGELIATGANFGDIPVVKAYSIDSISDMAEFIAVLKLQHGVEGAVVAWDDGSRAKGKTDWYVRIHRAKEMMRSERHLLDLWFENEIDDLLPSLFTEDRERIATYINRFTRELWSAGSRVQDLYTYVRDVYDSKKDFAISTAGVFSHADRCMMFALWDNKFENGITLADSMVKRGLTSTEKFDETITNLGMKTQWEETVCQTSN